MLYDLIRGDLMVEAVFLDFYGTVVYEDNEIITVITKQILLSGKAHDATEIGLFWWQEFAGMFTKASGVNFLTQRELELESLRNTIKRFKSTEDVYALSQTMYDHWMSPPIFKDSKRFFELCPVPVYIVSNIDTDDINKALAFHNIKPAGIVTSEDARTYKPNKEIFEFALNKFGLIPDEAVHIGDSYSSDIQGAKAARINAIWINRSNKPIPEGVDIAVSNLLDALKTKYFE
jgi:2-haloacid dehalogenase/putative hydrolase of the HAD superfamily